MYVLCEFGLHFSSIFRRIRDWPIVSGRGNAVLRCLILQSRLVVVDDTRHLVLQCPALLKERDTMCSRPYVSTPGDRGARLLKHKLMIA